VMLIKIRYAQI